MFDLVHTQTVSVCLTIPPKKSVRHGYFLLNPTLSFFLSLSLSLSLSLTLTLSFSLALTVPRLSTLRLSSPTSYSLSIPSCVLHVYFPLHPILYLTQVVYFTTIFPYILLSIYPKLCTSRLSSPTSYSLCVPRLCTSRLSSPTSYSLSNPGCVLHVYLPLHPTLYLSQVVYFTSIFPYILLSI